MDSSKEIIELWVNGHTKLLENFMQASEMMQKALLSDGISARMIEEIGGIYENWQAKQTKIMEDFVLQLKQKPLSDDMKQHFEKFVKTTQNMNKAWSDIFQDITTQYTGFDSSAKEKVEQLNDKWNTMYQEWSSTIVKPFKEFSNTTTNVYNTVVGTVKDYMRAFAPIKK